MNPLFFILSGIAAIILLQDDEKPKEKPVLTDEKKADINPAHEQVTHESNTGGGSGGGDNPNPA